MSGVKSANSKYEKLFEPISIGKLKLKNRTSMAPMGLICYSDPNGGFNREAQDYYIERAKGGVGLIITGICAVDCDEMPEQALPCPTHNPLLFCESTAPMIEKIHAHDARIFLQITGRLRRSRGACGARRLFTRPIRHRLLQQANRRVWPRPTRKA